MEYVEGQTLAQVIRDLRRLEGLEDREAEEDDPRNLDLADSLASGQFAPAQAGSAGEDPTAAYAGEPTPADRVAGVTRSKPPEAETVGQLQAAISTERSTKSPAYFRSIARLGAQVAEALDHAHEEGVIHRDVKPSNLILDARGKVWVTDFGLARVESDPGLTMTGDLLGTLRYMSPEQALGKRIVLDHRTDVYSLGASLYELLTLQPVFPGEDREDLLRQIAFEEPKPPRSVSKAIGADLETIVLKSIAKNPAERYATAGDLADDLQRFLADQPIRAKRPTLLKRAAKWSRRHQAVVWSAVIILLLAAIGLAVSNFLIAQQRDIAEAAADTAEDERDEADRQRGDDPALQADLAAAYFRVGETTAQIGSKEEALKAQRNAFDIRKQLAAENPTLPDYQHALAETSDHDQWRRRSDRRRESGIHLGRGRPVRQRERQV